MHFIFVDHLRSWHNIDWSYTLVSQECSLQQDAAVLI